MDPDDFVFAVQNDEVVSSRRYACDYSRDNDSQYSRDYAYFAARGVDIDRFTPMDGSYYFTAYPTRNPLWCYTGGPEPDQEPEPLPDVQDTGPEPVVCKTRITQFSRRSSYTTCYRLGDKHSTTSSAPLSSTSSSSSLQKRPVVYSCKDDGIILQKPTLESLYKESMVNNSSSSRDGSVRTFAASSIGGGRVSRVEEEKYGFKAFVAHVVGGDITPAEDGTSSFVVKVFDHLIMS